MGLRHQSIRLRVLLLVLIPVLSLIGVYAYAATITVHAAVSLDKAKTVKNVIAEPAGNLQTQLDAERRLSLLYLADPAARSLAQLTRQQGITNQAVKVFDDTVASGAVRADASQAEQDAAQQLVTATRTLPALRSVISTYGITRPTVLSEYSAIVTSGYRVLEGAVQQYDNVPLVIASENLIKLDEVDQLVLQESDLYASDLATRSFPGSDRVEFTELVAVRQYLLADTLPALTPAAHADYDMFVTKRAAVTLTRLENTIIRAPAVHGLPPVAPATWVAAVTTYSVGLGKALTLAANQATAGAQSQADRTYLQLILAGGLGLLAIIASLLFSLLVGRGLIRQLHELRESALDLANDRLPSVMARLRDGETVDIAAEAPPVESSADEIDQVRQAFNIVQRTAIEAAVDEANLRRGVSEVFRNLARRSQVLLHRQLRLLDGMERRASEPDELEDLFRIDHLTTRMRRHAEGLIILSGESPGRSWRTPVPLLDVLRAAVAEVEDYTRIRVDSPTSAALAGPAVADVIHLIAELAENATVFSPPNTPVRIQGDMVGRGFAIEVEDRGLGITGERLAEINRNLSDPPAFDLSGSDRLGLFIAGRLAHRHDIKITLRPSPYGGTTAIVIIPMSLVVSEDAYEHVPAIGADGRALPLGGRHAALTDGTAAGAGNGGAGGNGSGVPADTGEQRPAASTGSWPRRQQATALPSPSPSPSPSLTAMPSPASSASPVGAATPPSMPTLPSMPALPTVPTPRPAGAWATAATPPTADDPGWWSRAAAASSARPRSEIRTRPRPEARSEASGDLAGSRGGLADGLDPLMASAEPGDLGLPVRVRQASLAPQLREASRDDDDLPARQIRPASAEAARNTMAALQRGWERGRSGDAEPSADAGTDAPPAGGSTLDGADK